MSFVAVGRGSARTVSLLTLVGALLTLGPAAAWADSWSATSGELPALVERFDVVSEGFDILARPRPVEQRTVDQARSLVDRLDRLVADRSVVLNRVASLRRSLQAPTSATTYDLLIERIRALVERAENRLAGDMPESLRSRYSGHRDMLCAWRDVLLVRQQRVSEQGADVRAQLSAMAAALIVVEAMLDSWFDHAEIVKMLLEVEILGRPTRDEAGKLAAAVAAESQRLVESVSQYLAKLAEAERTEVVEVRYVGSTGRLLQASASRARKPGELDDDTMDRARLAAASVILDLATTTARQVTRSGEGIEEDTQAALIGATIQYQWDEQRRSVTARVEISEDNVIGVWWGASSL